MSDSVLCEVVDHGPGVPAGQWERLFDAFQRVDDRSPGGLGLGLSVARGLADAAGAQLVPARTEGGGLTMRVVLPLAAR
jgi:two-component system sensor histidine kinase KdpD